MKVHSGSSLRGSWPAGQRRAAKLLEGNGKKEWRNLSLFRFSSLVTALAAHDPARRQGMYGLRRQGGGVPVPIISLYRRVFEHATPGTSRLRRESRQLVRHSLELGPERAGLGGYRQCSPPRG
jgi:hypothetical protein